MSRLREVISTPHQKVHDGDFYQVGTLLTCIANGCSAEFLIKVGACQSLHTVISTSVTGKFIGYLYEAPTIAVCGCGTALTAINSNRNSCNTAEGTFFHTPCTTADGTQLAASLIPGGTGGKAIGGSASTSTRDGAEIILATSTNYLIRLTNDSGQARDVSITISFYESPGSG